MVPIIAVYGVTKAAIKATSNNLVVRVLARLRKILTTKFHEMYMDNTSKLFYVCNDLDKRLDNVDSRISNDIEFMFNDFAEFFYGGVRETEGGFLPKFASYCTGIVLCFIKMPMMCGFFVLISSVLIFIPSLMSSVFLMRTQEKQQRVEAEFRSQHNRVKADSESIGFYGGEATEAKFLQEKWEYVRRNWKSFAARKTLMDFCNLATDNIAGVLALVVAIVVAEQYGVAQAMPALRCSKKVFENVTEMSQQFLDFAKASGNNARVMFLHKTFLEFQLRQETLQGRGDDFYNDYQLSNATCCGLRQPKIQKMPIGDLAPVTFGNDVIFKHADIWTPTGDRLLLQDVNLYLHKGQSCLIVGPSGIGKSSLLRVLGRLWPLFKSHPTGTFFLPNIFFKL